jgi:hypothetical protein
MKRLNDMSTARRATTGVALLGVLATAVFFAASALAGGSLATPSITVKPANPTNSQSASFTYTDSSTITKFQCQLDGSVSGAVGPGTVTVSVGAATTTDLAGNANAASTSTDADVTYAP